MKKNNRKNFALAATALAAAMTFSTAAEAQTPSFPFSKSRARLVVLLHGVTPKMTEAPEQEIQGSGHARHYWGFDFIKGLQGRVDETSMRVITPQVFGGKMTFRNTLSSEWKPEGPGQAALDLAPICFPVSWLTSLPAGIETNQTLIKDHIRLLTKNGADSTMVMISTRDGSKHFMPQLAEAIDEIYRSYVTAFGHLPENQQPQIYLVGHSFGGVIARGILANPTQMDLFGNSLPAAQRAQANFLRDRVVLIKTIGAPHRGTHIADPAGDAADLYSTVGLGFIHSYYSFIAALPWKNYSSAWVNQKTADMLHAGLDAISGKRDCLKDLTRMEEYNNGILNTNTMRRGDNSLVPIYTAAGRNPGGMFYDQSRSVFYLGGGAWNPISNLDIAGGNRPAKEAMALNIIGSVMHLKGYGREGRKPWGTATLADGDRVASPYQGFGQSFARAVSAPLAVSGNDIKILAGKFFEGKPYTMGKADGEWDNDGFLGWDSAHGIGLAGSNWYRVFSPTKYGGQLPWDNDNHGSMMFNPGNGLWIHNELVRQAGPYNHFPGSRRSTWASNDVPVTPLNGIRLDFLEVHDIANNLDYLSGADFTLRVRVGSTESTVNLKDDTRTVTNAPSFYLNNFAGSVIPIRIDVIERDTPDPNDICPLTPELHRTSLYLFFDTRTNRITGDMEALAGDTMYIKPPASLANRVSMKLRVVRTQ